MNNYRYLNVQPDNLILPDCVVRAITLGTGEDYDEVIRKLNLFGELYDCDSLCINCYENLIDKYYEFPRVEGFKDCPIYEFLINNPVGVYIIRVEGHLTTAIDGMIYDIWDCTKEIIDIVWRVI